MELEAHLLIAERLRYLGAEQVQTILVQTAELGRMLGGLQRSLQALR